MGVAMCTMVQHCPNQKPNQNGECLWVVSFTKKGGDSLSKPFSSYYYYYYYCYHHHHGYIWAFLLL